jgi:hypothetical protein
VQFQAADAMMLDSPFYFLAFDGSVGLVDDALDRDGYGAAFQVDGTDVFRVSRADEVKTRNGTTNTARSTISVQRTDSFSALNARPSSRGKLLDVFHQSDAAQSMVFSPSLATPLLLRVQQPKILKPFSALYSLRVGDVAQDVGEQALFWTGAGACRDFDGKGIEAQWQQTPDRRGRASDHVANAADFYGLEWQKAASDQSVYLKTVAFVAPNHALDLHGETPNVSFITVDATPSASARLSGIRPMAFNRSGTTASDSVTALDDLFELVKGQQVCVTNTGVRSTFWWNPDALYATLGATGKSIEQIETTLSGNACK